MIEGPNAGVARLATYLRQMAPSRQNALLPLAHLEKKTRALLMNLVMI